MKFKVLKRFLDKENRQLILPGSSFESDDKKRLTGMFDRGLLEGELPKEVEKKETVQPKQTEQPKPSRKKRGE